MFKIYSDSNGIHFIKINFMLSNTGQLYYGKKDGGNTL